MMRSGTILDLIPEHCIERPARHVARMVKHEITIIHGKDLIDHIVRQICGLEPQEALAVIQKYVRRCSYSERHIGFRKEIILNVELSDGSRNAYIQVRVELGPFQNLITSLTHD